MSNNESSVFKLFGKTIQTIHNWSSSSSSPSSEDDKAAGDAASAKRTEASQVGLPCPRCKSEDTKFCYFNNYNVNQPRHFCRACHRFWTAGGTLRDVPVGAGRRKNRAQPAAAPVGVGDQSVRWWIRS